MQWVYCIDSIDSPIFPACVSKRQDMKIKIVIISRDCFYFWTITGDVWSLEAETNCFSQNTYIFYDHRNSLPRKICYIFCSVTVFYYLYLIKLGWIVSTCRPIRSANVRMHVDNEPQSYHYWVLIPISNYSGIKLVEALHQLLVYLVITDPTAV